MPLVLLDIIYYISYVSLSHSNPRLSFSPLLLYSLVFRSDDGSIAKKPHLRIHNVRCLAISGDLTQSNIELLP